ncbi:hypothetical protein FLP10_11330 [Agromyces intestinalis]|uniref:Uncharacterized protein n=1 Tax=Agromyces intestinalis TaxID=2592652 RepID=A0A5C1YJF7_9MICO|nr:hypothetical protein [Agromyces intestinalis]QEO14942.1 hypothetical protein FLP10_11330 [Agromyces intestinalis]
MEFVGILPEDAPDPRTEALARLRTVPFRVVGFEPQPSLEDLGWPGFAEGSGPAGTTELAVSLTYQLWRNPADPDDPANLADLDERVRASLDEVPPWPRPEWLVAQVERMRYAQLWEAVRTSWHRAPSEFTTLERQLVDHVNHLLMNRFRAELGLGPAGPIVETGWRAATNAVRGGLTTTLDGESVAAVELDTDPFVYGIGFELEPGVVVTAAVPRADLDHVRLAFARVT